MGDDIIFTGIIRDITSRKRTEEEYVKIEKLNSLSVLAGGIAHDFNNLLAVVTIGVELIESSLPDSCNDNETTDHINRVEKALKQAHFLTRQLLTFSRGGKPVKTIISTSELIRESVNLFLCGSKAKCEFDIAENLWPIDADKGQISQVIQNIVINANQAMPQGGVITLSAENINIENDNSFHLKGGRYVNLTITDDGPGISGENLERIFDPYFTTKEKGSGLGLATCNSIIHKHGGKIIANSEEGKGTAFSIYLPSTNKKVKVPKNINESNLNKTKRKILLMDDEESVLSLVMNVITLIGHEVEIARNGHEAITLYQQSVEKGDPFDVVILDLTVPGSMGGKETILRLIEIDPSVRAIVASGYSNDKVLSNYDKYGFKAAIQKPFNIKELSEVIERVIVERRNRELTGLLSTVKNFINP